MRPLLAVLAVVLLAGCAGSGVLKAQRSALLEKAKSAGVIDQYRVLAYGGPCGTRAYGIDGGNLAIRLDNSCYGRISKTLEIWYTRARHDKGLALWRLAGWGHRIECGPGCVP